MIRILAGLMGCASLAAALDPASLAPNRWHKAPLHWRLPASEPGGAFQPRGWGSLQYNAGSGTLVFYEGFGPSSRGNYCIYGNALYEYSIATDTASLRALGNWFCEVGHLPTPLPANAGSPTPMDRHTYSQTWPMAPRVPATIPMISGPMPSPPGPGSPWERRPAEARDGNAIAKATCSTIRPPTRSSISGAAPRCTPMPSPRGPGAG
jgi:hypothetical protein